MMTCPPLCYLLRSKCIMTTNKTIRCILVALLFLSVPKQLAASPGSDFVQLEHGRLTANIEEKQVMEVLLDLAEKGNFGLQFVGEIDRTISAEFKETNLISGIKDILRLAGLSYIMVKQPSPAGSSQEERLYSLLVCAGDQTDSGRREYADARDSREIRQPRGQWREQPAAAVVAATGEQGDSEGEKRIEFEGSREDLQQFVDNLVQKGDIQPEEYEKIVHIMDRKH